MKIADVKKKFKNTWVLAEVLKENELNQPVNVRPIMASQDKNELYDKLGGLPENKTSGKTFTTLYTGKITGAFIFNVYTQD